MDTGIPRALGDDVLHGIQFSELDGVDLTGHDPRWRQVRWDEGAGDVLLDARATWIVVP